MSATVQMTEYREERPMAENEILTPAATEFLHALNARFEERRVSLLNQRKLRQQQYDRGELPKFLAETQSIRDAEWTVAPIPPDLLDRRRLYPGAAGRRSVHGDSQRLTGPGSTHSWCQGADLGWCR